MKSPTFESASAAIAPRKKSLEERRESRRQGGSKDHLHHALPEDRSLAELLGFDDAPAVEDILRTALLHPIADLTSNPGKRIRAQLVSFSYRLLSGEMPPSVAAAKRCRSCAEVVELIHAGSLVIDDIEDGSTVRRGRSALHVRYGMPIALNAGNWLYFWPFQLLKEAGLGEEDLLLVYERYHRTLLRAHFGQALDLGSKVDTLAQNSVTEVCLASMRLKTGALMGFATLLGGALADASERSLSILDDFGRDLGVALQMFDDLGNVIGRCEPSKRYEDLILSRPSWVWACAAQIGNSDDYREFVAAAHKLPEAGDLEAWMERHRLIQTTRQSARAHLDRCFENLRYRLRAEGVRWSARAFDELRAVGEEIAVAYG
jgi:geranylgeranyl pyrophosphate synthase